MDGESVDEKYCHFSCHNYSCVVSKKKLSHWRHQTLNPNWIETNVEIIDSDFSRFTNGTEISQARGETTRRVTLTVKIFLSKKDFVIVTKKVSTKTRNKAFFEKGKFISILYNPNNPNQFKLKYDI